MNTINVVYTVNKAFYVYLAVSVASLVTEHKRSGEDKDYKLDIYIVQIGFTQTDKEKLTAMIGLIDSNVRLIFYDYTPQNKFANSPYKNIEIVTLVYYLPSIFPDLEKVIFFDADSVLTQGVSELWGLDLEHYWVGTTPCILDPGFMWRFARQWSVEQTINAGVFVLSLKRMRELDVTRTLEEFTNKYQKLLNTPEQQAIAACYPIRKIVDHKWNWRGLSRASEIFWGATNSEVGNEYLKIKPAMVHFQNPLRPTQYIINSKYFKIWMGYHKMLGLEPLSPKPLNFRLFSNLMNKNLWKLYQKNNFKVKIAMYANSLICWCFYWRKYQADPDGFVFPTIDPGP